MFFFQVWPNLLDIANHIQNCGKLKFQNNKQKFMFSFRDGNMNVDFWSLISIYQLSFLLFTKINKNTFVHIAID